MLNVIGKKKLWKFFFRVFVFDDRFLTRSLEQKFRSIRQCFYSKTFVNFPLLSFKLYYKINNSIQRL